jgi:hypothetical protein
MSANVSLVTSLALAGALGAALATLAARASVRRATLKSVWLTKQPGIEWDNDVPPFPVLAGEVARAKAGRSAHVRSEKMW